MENSIKLFGSIIIDPNNIISINIEKGEQAVIANIFKAIFVNILILIVLSVLYFHAEIIRKLSYEILAFYLVSIILISFLVYSHVIDCIFSVKLRRVSVLLDSGCKIYSEYISYVFAERYVEYTKRRIENLKHKNDILELDNYNFMYNNESGDRKNLWVLKKVDIMEFNVKQTLSSWLLGIAHGVHGGVFVQIIVFDGENIKEYNSGWPMLFEDACKLKNELYEKFNS